MPCYHHRLYVLIANVLISVFFDIQLPGALARHNTYLPSEAKYLKRPGRSRLQGRSPEARQGRRRWRDSQEPGRQPQVGHGSRHQQHVSMTV